MMFRSLASQVLLAAVLATLLVVGCVDIPSTGHTPPDYKASIRVMYTDPAITATANIVVAEGPDFDTFVTNIFPSGSFGTVSAYSTLNAGGKQLFLSPGDADTAALSIATDQRGTLIVLPRETTADPRFLLKGEGRTFEDVGVDGSSQVRVVNAIMQGGADTMSVTIDVYRTSDSTTVATNLAFGAISGNILVAAGATESFYVTRTGEADALGDAVSVTGASHMDFTVVGTGTADDATLSPYPNE